MYIVVVAWFFDIPILCFFNSRYEVLIIYESIFSLVQVINGTFAISRSVKVDI